MTASSQAAKNHTRATGLRRVAAVLTVWFGAIVRPRRFKESRLLPPYIRLVIGALAGLALVAFAMLFLDAPGVVFAKSLPLWVVETFNEITDFGKSGWFLIPIGGLIVLAAILCTPAAGRITTLMLTSLIVRLGYVFIAIALPSLFVTIVKRLIGRVRPSELGPYAYVPWSWKPAFASMPSGHATTAAAAAIAIGALWPKARAPMWAYAALIMASRVIIEAHYVSDVIAAAFVGGFGAILARNWFAARGLAFVPGTDGAVRTLPGPSWRRVKAVARCLLAQ
ncbi:MAG: phosphatase PAP2 family protein [Alphaproteobacteria bacterium]|nr:MAG: phosphatase PAP2 family protein [Alphaproteobacteria bacterium]